MKEELLSLAEDYGEFTIDSLLPEGILKDLPIAGPIISTLKICKNIRDLIFLQKLKSFLECVDKNEKWKERYQDVDECTKISRQLLYIIDSSDDDKKLKLIGLAFNKLVMGNIDKEEFFYVSTMLQRAYYLFLNVLPNIPEDDRVVNDGSEFDMDAIAHLLSIGALSYDGQSMAVFKTGFEEMISPPSIIIRVNRYGLLLKELLQERPNQ